jgi:tetratricopeptide (TPR) repeat protein/Tfp pilus assembly protein PilZ
MVKDMTTATTLPPQLAGQTPVQKHPRYPTNAPVDLVLGAEIVKAPLVNISLGGVFIRTDKPPPTGSPVRLRLHWGDIPLAFQGRVVHVIDPHAGAKKGHPAGIGVQFDNVAPSTLQQLTRLVDVLAEEARREKARKSAVRFADSVTVHVHVDRAVLTDLWNLGLKHGGLFAEGAPPPFGTVVKVIMGTLELVAEVVHVDKNGAGLQLKDLEGAKKATLVRFLDGTADTLVHKENKPLGPPLEKVLVAARRLFTGIEEGDNFGALGLPITAAEHEVKQRCEGLRRLFSVPPPDASPPQRARIEAAQRALERIEPFAIARAVALRREAELVKVPDRQAQVRVDDEVRDLIANAGNHERKGERAEAKRLLLRAVELAPDHPVARRRLDEVSAAIDALSAMQLLDRADVFVAGTGMKQQAIDAAREASRLSRARPVQLRACRVLAKAGLPEEAIIIAEALAAEDPKDAHALTALLTLHEKMQSWREAARAGEALLRLKAGDAELQKRVKKAVDMARKA